MGVDPRSRVRCCQQAAARAGCHAAAVAGAPTPMGAPKFRPVAPRTGPSARRGCRRGSDNFKLKLEGPSTRPALAENRGPPAVRPGLDGRVSAPGGCRGRRERAAWTRWGLRAWLGPSPPGPAASTTPTDGPLMWSRAQPREHAKGRLEIKKSQVECTVRLELV
jgi:hypothetical protein